MFNQKELSWIIVSVIIASFIFALHKDPSSLGINIFFGIIVFLIVIITNTVAKKIAAGFFSCKIEYDVWSIQRYNVAERSHFKKPFPIGLLLPFCLAFLSLGYVECMTFLQFNFENLERKRMLKNRGLTRKTEINESDPAAIAAWGFLALLILAIFASLIHYFFKDAFVFGQIAKYSIVYGIWNLLPIGQLDGSRLFFGSFIGYFLIGIVYLISLALVVLFI